MQIDLSKFRATFFEEASDHLEAMEAALLQLESQPTDAELLNQVFRGAHSIKGASGTFGLKDVAEFTHVLENLLDRMRDGEVIADPDLIGLLFKSLDVLTGLLDAAKDSTDPPTDVEEILAGLHRANGSTAAKSTPKAEESTDPTDPPIDNQTVFRIKFEPSRDFFRFGQDPLLLFRELSDLGEIVDVQLDISELPPFTDFQPEECYLAWTFELKTSEPIEAIRDVFLFINEESGLTVDEKESTPTSETNSTPATESTEEHDSAETERRSGTERRAEPPTKSSTGRETVRVDRERLDSLINQIGELVIGASMVEQDWKCLADGRESTSLTQMGKVVRDLQEMSLSLRMVPIAATFQKMTRIVRDLTNKLGKHVVFETVGEETELDKTVVDQISDPLLHMIRNSVDHGIESPEERIAAGKPENGKIEVRASHRGGNIYIELEDDGKGLDLEAIRKKAIERGVISESDTLSDSEICDLIFHAGLSTAKNVSDVSGRGVGMDVVRRNVEALNGTVTLRSEKGVGTTVTVRFPLTLAILDGLLVRLGEEVYIVPLLSVVESFRPRPEDVKKLAGQVEVAHVRGEVLPLLRLHSILNVESDVTDPSQGLLVIVEDHGSKLGLLVDDLIGQQQAVIKTLETNFRKVPGIAGATILGDGRVALILDIDGIKDIVESQGLEIRGGLESLETDSCSPVMCP